MNTDRELLGAAAKAAGLKIHAAWQAERDEHGYGNLGLWIVNVSTCWNPLTDDGDALRLAVALNLCVVFHPALNQAVVREYHSTEKEWQENGEDHSDPYAATRRAIVRAAAEIGRSMK